MVVTSKSGKKYTKYIYKKGGTAAKGRSEFSKAAIKRQLGRRADTPANRSIAAKELKALVKYDEAKQIRRASERRTAEQYSARKAASKRADMEAMMRAPRRRKRAR